MSVDSARLRQTHVLKAFQSLLESESDSDGDSETNVLLESALANPEAAKFFELLFEEHNWLLRGRNSDIVHSLCKKVAGTSEMFASNTTVVSCSKSSTCTPLGRVCL